MTEKEEKFLNKYSLEELKTKLEYNSNTGNFHWLKSNFWKIKPGDIAGTVSNKGYHYIRFGDTSIFSHRLAWLFSYGCFPDGVLDHINNNRLDNRLVNLRQATTSQNNMNKPVQANNLLQVKGVYFNKKRSKFCATAKLNGKHKHLGYFSNLEKASEAYQIFAINNFKEFANGA
jgi:hypothetical protein